MGARRSGRRRRLSRLPSARAGVHLLPVRRPSSTRCCTMPKPPVLQNLQRNSREATRLSVPPLSFQHFSLPTQPARIMADSPPLLNVRRAQSPSKTQRRRAPSPACARRQKLTRHVKTACQRQRRFSALDLGDRTGSFSAAPSSTTASFFDTIKNRRRRRRAFASRAASDSLPRPFLAQTSQGHRRAHRGGTRRRTGPDRQPCRAPPPSPPTRSGPTSRRFIDIHQATTSCA